MKKYLIILLLLISVSAFAQPGSLKISGLFVRVLDSAAYQAAAASSHSASPSGYSDIYWNAQATKPHYDIWNGSSYDHVFAFGGGAGSALTDQTLTDDVTIDTDGHSLTFSQNTSGIQISSDGSAAVGVLSGDPGGGVLAGPDGIQLSPDKSGPNPEEGSLFVVGSDGYLDEVPIGTNAQVLTSDGTTVSWEAASTSIGAQDLYVGSVAMWPRVTNGCASLAQTEMTTSLFNVQSLDFDQTTQEFAQMQFVMPRNWNNGTITATVYWTAASGSGGVVWGVSGGAYSNDDALTVAFGTAQTVSDTFIAANDLHITSTSSAITLAGTPADADFIAIQISRNPADGSDTLNADAKLLGIRVTFTLDAGTSE